MAAAITTYNDTVANGSSANWSVNGTWNPSTAQTRQPGNNAGDTAIINQGTVIEDKNTTISHLIINGGNLNFSVSGVTLNVNNGVGTVDLSSGSINISTNATLTALNFNMSGGTFTENNGTLTVNTAANFNGGTATFSGGNFNGGGTLNVDGGVLRLSGAAVTVGAVNINSGNFNLSAGTANTGALTVQNTGIFKMSGGTLNAGTNNLSVTGGAFNQSGGTVTIGNANFGGGNDTINSIFNASGTVTVNTALNIGSSGVLTTTSNLATAITIGPAGNINIAGGTLNAASGGIADSGTLIGFGTVTGKVGGPNGSVVEASGGTLTLSGGAITATTLEVANASSAILDLNNSSISGGTVTFLGTAGTLLLGGSDFSSQNLTGFSDTIAGLNVASTTTPTTLIDLTGVNVANVTSANVVGTTLKVNEGATTVATLTLSSPVPVGTFVDWQADAGTGTDIFLSTAPCYCRGTLIRTETGEVAVEELAIGDRVMNFAGQAKPVKWIGHRAYDGRFIAGNREGLPIRVAAGALADGVPARDLFLSPTHSLYIDGVLAPAEYLLNGATITQAESVAAVEYFHIELDTHDIIFADGAPAETFADCDNRGMFQNAGEFAGLYPDDDRSAKQFCATRLEEGEPELTAIRAAIARRGGLPEETPESGTDHLPNPTMAGAAIGMLGEGGALPAGWQIYSAAGLGCGVVGSGQEDGTDYVDIRIFGTPNATTSTNQIFLAGAGEIPASLGERWVAAADVRLCAGSLANVRAIQIGANLNDADSRYSSWFGSTACTPVGEAPRWIARSDEIADRNAAYLQPLLQIATTVGRAIDLTLRIARPRAALLGHGEFRQERALQRRRAA